MTQPGGPGTCTWLMNGQAITASGSGNYTGTYSAGGASVSVSIPQDSFGCTAAGVYSFTASGGSCTGQTWMLTLS